MKLEKTKEITNLQIADATCTALWEEDVAENSQLQNNGTARARSHCTYGCGCYVGYLFVQSQK